MQRPWLSHYPPEVPHSVDPDRYSSVVELLENAFQRHGDRRFTVCMDVWMTYRELDHLSAQLAAWLQSLNLEPGARVAIMLPNIPQFAVSTAAVLRAGYTCVNVNPLYTARELEHQLQDSGATAIIILENFAQTLSQVIDRTQVKQVCLTSMGDLLGNWYGRWITFAVRHLAKMVPPFELPALSGRVITEFRAALEQGAKHTLRRRQPSHDSPAFLQYTGGTTGLAKGAVLTHRNIIAATLQAEAWFTPGLKSLHDVRESHNVAALPLYHIYALTLCLMTIHHGSSMSLIPNPRDIPKFVAVLAKRPFHLFPGVNTLFNALLQNERFRQLDFSKLCVSQAGGMAASEGTAQQWQKVTASCMIQGWGMTEGCAIGTNNPMDTRSFTGSVGLPLPGIDMAIKDEDGQDLPIGESGELCIRGPNIMSGYYNHAEETARSFTADGFMRTGDIGTMDERGYFWILDRKKDMIIVSGFNVFPSELESVISMCPGVLECAAIGVPDEHSGEAVKLFVVRSDPNLSETTVADYCHQHLTGYKRPKSIEFRDSLPKTNVGKILRRGLRETETSAETV